jgi:osmotically-inducible protein OsmY
MFKSRCVALILVACVLTSCIAVVVAGAAAGLIVYDRRSAFTMERDARIFHVIQKAIIPNPEFRDSRIVIVSFNQVVLLVGQTPTASSRVVAERVAQQTPNVRHVYDEITVESPISFKQQSQDTLITGEVRSHILTKKGLESGSIRIVTENAVVYLMGIVTAEQANLAVDVARQIKGVQKVVKVFQYIS